MPDIIQGKSLNATMVKNNLCENLKQGAWQLDRKDFIPVTARKKIFG
jgi:hypothetical protein